ncbi:hypothetical protein [Streptomyces sp. NBC_01754]|uniref:hypothetical protein n=1 Tax=Streptomyces sp. NBC_01754 TaxID=2975930 RepID=UPI003FA35083
MGTAFGRYGGVRTRDEVRKPAVVAGGAVMAGVRPSISRSGTGFAETHPAASPVPAP